jgi:hypothetical protein
VGARLVKKPEGRAVRKSQRDFPLEVFDPFGGFLGREVLGKQLRLVSY